MFRETAHRDPDDVYLVLLALVNDVFPTLDYSTLSFGPSVSVVSVAEQSTEFLRSLQSL